MNLSPDPNPISIRTIKISLELADSELNAINWWRTHNASKWVDINNMEQIIHDMFEQIIEPHIEELSDKWE